MAERIQSSANNTLRAFLSILASTTTLSLVVLPIHALPSDNSDHSVSTQQQPSNSTKDANQSVYIMMPCSGPRRIIRKTTTTTVRDPADAPSKQKCGGKKRSVAGDPKKEQPTRDSRQRVWLGEPTQFNCRTVGTVSICP